MILKTIYSDNLLKKLAPQLIKNNIILEIAEILIKRHLIENIKYLVFLDRIGEMQAWELDYVAQELHVDYYNYTMSLAEKRKACQDFLIIHSLKGTVGGIKKALDIFFKNSSLEEWHQYDGEAGYFRVKIDGTVPANLEHVKERIENVKKKSQHLEKLIFLSGSQQKLYYGTHMMHGKKSSIFPARVSFQFKNTNIEVQTGTAVTRIVKEGVR